MIDLSVKEGDLITIYDWRFGTTYQAIVVIPPEIMEGEDYHTVGIKFKPNNNDWYPEDRDEDGYWYHYAVENQEKNRWDDGEL